MSQNKTENRKYWALPTDKVLEELRATVDGLSQEEVKARQLRFGRNELPRSKRLPRLRILLEQFQSPIIIVLIVAGLVTLFIDDFTSSIFIFLAVAVNVLLGFYQENKAETAIAGLQKFLKEEVRVIRGGVEKEIDAGDVVPGDIIRLMPGSRVVADCRLLEVGEFSVDEAILTGESMPVTHKSSDPVKEETGVSDRTSMVFAGTFVGGGLAVVVATATGSETELGKIAKEVATANREQTPLQVALNRFALQATVFLGILTIGLFAAGVVAGRDLVEMFLISVAVAVSAVPEGLPVSLTVILAVGVERLAKRKGVVRKLMAAETLGSTTLILTDKTGTLTQAKMALSEIVSELPKEEVLEAALINTDVIIENPADDTSLWRIDGRPLEVALVMAAAEHKVLLSEIKIKSKTLEVKPFNSTQKYSATQVQIGERKHWNYLGAPEILLELVGLESNERAKILEKMDELAYSGSRVLGVARDKTFLGLIAFRDSPRLGVAEALHRADLAGVRTVVVTGDHRGTAESLVKELGIEIGAHAVIEGGAMRDLSDAEMRKRLPHLKVFARMTPQDKLRLANLYREMGEVVAMTGDGVNDAPAIKNADIGIALGSGTEIAKGAADLVILDDNFETIVAAIEEGRRILSNVKKVIVYLLSNSFDSLLLIGGSVLLGIALPLNALQILWVNFFTDSFPGVAFAFEDGEDYLKEAPTKMNKRIFDGELKFFVLGLGGLSSVLLLALYVVLLRQGIDPELVRTFIFAIFSMYSLFLAFSVRHLRISILKYNIFSNPYLLGSVVVGICLSLAAIYLPFLQNILGTISLPLPWLAGVLGFSLFNILIFELAKSLFHKTKKAR